MTVEDPGRVSPEGDTVRHCSRACPEWNLELGQLAIIGELTTEIHAHLSEIERG